MRHVNKPSDRKLIEFAASQQSIETQLTRWIQELVQSYSELVPALQRLRRSNRVLQSRKAVTDAEEVLGQVERALDDAEISSLIGLTWLRGPRGT
jgi:hypothetical protein